MSAGPFAQVPNLRVHVDEVDILGRDVKKTRRGVPLFPQGHRALPLGQFLIGPLEERMLEELCDQRSQRVMSV